MQCTQCKSDNTQRLSVIYQAGTNHISTTSTTFGGAAGTGFGMGSAVTNTSGTSQSYLANKAAPPPKKSFKKTITLFSFWVLSLFIGSAYLLIFLPLLIAAVVTGYRALRYNSDQYPALRAIWLKSWHCNKCGTIYTE